MRLKCALAALAANAPVAPHCVHTLRVKKLSSERPTSRAWLEGRFAQEAEARPRPLRCRRCNRLGAIRALAQRHAGGPATPLVAAGRHRPSKQSRARGGGGANAIEMQTPSLPDGYRAGRVRRQGQAHNTSTRCAMYHDARQACAPATPATKQSAQFSNKRTHTWCGQSAIVGRPAPAFPLTQMQAPYPSATHSSSVKRFTRVAKVSVYRNSTHANGTSSNHCYMGAADIRCYEEAHRMPSSWHCSKTLWKRCQDKTGNDDITGSVWGECVARHYIVYVSFQFDRRRFGKQ